MSVLPKMNTGAQEINNHMKYIQPYLLRESLTLKDLWAQIEGVRTQAEVTLETSLQSWWDKYGLDYLYVDDYRFSTDGSQYSIYKIDKDLILYTLTDGMEFEYGLADLGLEDLVFFIETLQNTTITEFLYYAEQHDDVAYFKALAKYRDVNLIFNEHGRNIFRDPPPKVREYLASYAFQKMFMDRYPTEWQWLTPVGLDATIKQEFAGIIEGQEMGFFNQETTS